MEHVARKNDDASWWRAPDMIFVYCSAIFVIALTVFLQLYGPLPDQQLVKQAQTQNNNTLLCGYSLKTVTESIEDGETSPDYSQAQKYCSKEQYTVYLESHPQVKQSSSPDTALTFRSHCQQVLRRVNRLFTLRVAINPIGSQDINTPVQLMIIDNCSFYHYQVFVSHHHRMRMITMPQSHGEWVAIEQQRLSQRKP